MHRDVDRCAARWSFNLSAQRESFDVFKYTWSFTTYYTLSLYLMVSDHDSHDHRFFFFFILLFLSFYLTDPSSSRRPTTRVFIVPFRPSGRGPAQTVGTGKDGLGLPSRKEINGGLGRRRRKRRKTSNIGSGEDEGAIHFPADRLQSRNVQHAKDTFDTTPSCVLCLLPSVNVPSTVVFGQRRKGGTKDLVSPKSRSLLLLLRRDAAER